MKNEEEFVFDSMVMVVNLHLQNFIPETYYRHVEIVIGSNFEFASFQIAVQITKLLIVANVAAMIPLAFIHFVPYNRTTRREKKRSEFSFFPVE